MHRLAGRRFRRLVGALSVVVAGAALAGCSSATPSAAHRSTTTTGAATHRPTTTTSSTTSGRTSTTTTLPPPSSTVTTTAGTSTTGTTTGTAAAACSSGVLLLREDGLSAAAGTSHVTYLLTNEGPAACRIGGYPSVAFFGPSGAGGAGAGPSLAVRSFDLGHAASPVTLAHGAIATFVLSVSEVPVNGAGCQQAGSLQVTPPGAGAALSVRAGYTVCGGTVGVYPLSAAG